jgi:hypothetical protein
MHAALLRLKLVREARTTSLFGVIHIGVRAAA